MNNHVNVKGVLTMKKSIIVISVVTLLIGGTVGAYVFMNTSNTNASATKTSTTPAQEQGQPVRSAELKGTIKSIEGNEVVIINEISTDELTDAEREAKKAERQALSQEERQALKAEESATLQKENVTITIPVGVTVKKTTGDATGTLVDAQIADITPGVYVSIWVKDYKSANQQVEFVKIRTTN
jgi:uncharacterized membrane protein